MTAANWSEQPILLDTTIGAGTCMGSKKGQSGIDTATRKEMLSPQMLWGLYKSGILQSLGESLVEK